MAFAAKPVVLTINMSYEAFVSDFTVRGVFLRARLALGFMVLVSASAARAADGDIDTSFGTGPQPGASVFALPFSHSFANALEVGPSGEIWLASTKPSVGTPVPVVSFWITRLLASGAPDQTFNAGGPAPGLIDLLPSGPILRGTTAAAVDMVLSGPASSSVAYVLFQGSSVSEAIDRSPHDLAQFSDLIGRLPDDSGFGSYVGLARVATNGTLDTSFGAGGFVWVMSGAVTARAVDVDRAGNILALTSAKDLNSFHITRVNASGSIDTTWSNVGTQTVSLSGVLANAMVLDDQDRVVVAGMRANPGNAEDWDGFIYRALSNGAQDNGFGAAGLATVAPNLGGDNVDALNDVVIDGQGAIFAAGASRTGSTTAPTTCTVARVDASGNNADFEAISAGTQRECVAVAIARGNGDRVYVAGRTRSEAQAMLRGRLFAVRAGNLQADEGFGVAGVAATPAFNVDFDVTDVAVDASQRPIIVGGVSEQGESTYAARYVKSSLVFSDSFE